jgi:hypothetical protein
MCRRRNYTKFESLGGESKVETQQSSLQKKAQRLKPLTLENSSKSGEGQISEGGGTTVVIYVVESNLDFHISAQEEVATCAGGEQILGIRSKHRGLTTIQSRGK